ncbi:IclR family transcriptional regulator [Pseudonocardia xinjiangensis]|uniref:IclR family transcriptional regulator n=1 Tax=Pseudonocardia xinjiangensis TaxID=75289 RepID=A0ABX1RLT7_9PSEU|nr:IclR family transcriptional regulator [Pseudonocardia xinjiangensis]NMH80171.1 IclR family transcriptional regulator [Pseudonocardia xinjiangensis]
MPGFIQSIERAAAVLRLLGSTDRPLGLKEIAAALDLPPPTAHGIVRTLREVGFVEQDVESSRYRLGPGLQELGGGGWDPHDLRARAMNWADSLAGSTGMAVQVGIAASTSVRLVHHVFRPDGSPQRIRTGEEQPLHATALGKCLLAFAPVATPHARELDLQRWTGRTCTTVAALEAHLAVARRRGWASDTGEYETGVGGAAAPLRSSGGMVVAAIAVVGPVEELFGLGGELRPWMLEQMVGAAREISAALMEGR